jgi:phage-related tail protein
MSSLAKSPYEEDQGLSSTEKEFLEKLGEALKSLANKSNEIPFQVMLKKATAPSGERTEGEGASAVAATATPGAVALGWCWNGAVFVRC